VELERQELELEALPPRLASGLGLRNSLFKKKDSLLLDFMLGRM